MLCRCGWWYPWQARLTVLIFLMFARILLSDACGCIWPDLVFRNLPSAMRTRSWTNAQFPDPCVPNADVRASYFLMRADASGRIIYSVTCFQQCVLDFKQILSFRIPAFRMLMFARILLSDACGCILPDFIVESVFNQEYLYRNHSTGKNRKLALRNWVL